MGNNKQNLRISRRQVLARLGMLTVAAYAVPAVSTLSQAHSSSSSSEPSEPSEPSAPSAPSGPERQESEHSESDHCRSGVQDQADGALTISKRDSERAQASVDAGFAKPLHEIWNGINAAYPGRIIGIEFTGYRVWPRYRLRSISRSGRLETVIVSASTGEIVRIVGC